MGVSLHFESLREMERLAADRSLEARQTLGRTLSEWATDPDLALSEQEWSLVSAIYIAIAKDIENSVRARLADRLSQREDVPHSLVVALATDEARVAKPVLMESPLLDDQDLINIINECSGLHRGLVASRPELNARVSDTIVVTGDVKAIQLLLKNETAKIEESSFIQIGKLARKRIELQDPLVHRPDVPYVAVEKIIDLVSGNLLQEISERWSISQSTLVREMAVVKKEVAQEQRKARRPAVAPSTDDKETLISRLAEGDLNGASWVLYHSMRLPLGVSKAILADKAGFMLAIVLKAMSADTLTYSRALAVLSGRDPDAEQEFYRNMIQRYSGMNNGWAKERVAKWRTDPGSVKLA